MVLPDTGEYDMDYTYRDYLNESSLRHRSGNDYDQVPYESEAPESHYEEIYDEPTFTVAPAQKSKLKIGKKPKEQGKTHHAYGKIIIAALVIIAILVAIMFLYHWLYVEENNCLKDQVDRKNKLDEAAKKKSGN